MRSTRTDRVLAVALAATIVALAVLAPLAGSDEGAGLEGSVASTRDDGRRALALLFEELGRDTTAWRGLPGHLPRGEHLVWMPRAPRERGPEEVGDDPDEEAPGESVEVAPDASDEDRAGEPGGGTTVGDESSDEGGDGSSAETRGSTDESTLEDLEKDELGELDEAALEELSGELALAYGDRAPTHYRAFVERGGTLLLPAGGRAIAFLADDLGLEAARSLALEPKPIAGELVVRTSDGGSYRAAWEGAHAFEPLAWSSPAKAFWLRAAERPEDERPLAVELAHGAGRVVVLADDGFLANGRLREAEHALLAVRLAEELAPAPARILFDESALGLIESPDALDLALGRRLAPATLHLALLLALAVWRVAWVFAFPRDPEPLERVSPLSRARALAALLTRARRHDHAARELRAASLARLRELAGAPERRNERRPGPRTARAGEAPEDPAAERARAVDEVEGLAARLGFASDAPRWREALLDRAVADARALDALGRDLAAIEREAARGDELRGRMRRRAGAPERSRG